MIVFLRYINPFNESLLVVMPYFSLGYKKEITELRTVCLKLHGSLRLWILWVSFLECLSSLISQKPSSSLTSTRLAHDFTYSCHASIPHTRTQDPCLPSLPSSITHPHQIFLCCSHPSPGPLLFSLSCLPWCPSRRAFPTDDHPTTSQVPCPPKPPFMPETLSLWLSHADVILTSWLWSLSFSVQLLGTLFSQPKGVRLQIERHGMV